MSRQQQRKAQRDTNRKVGQLIGLRAENFTVRSVKKARTNLKSIIRLEGELMDMGVIKRPTRWDIFWGRLRITMIGLKRRAFGRRRRKA